MPNYSQAIVMGRLTRDPELRYVPSGAPVCDFTVAVNSRFTKESGEKVDRVDFYDVTFWNRLAEIAAQYLKKGRAAFVMGSLQQDRWDDPKTGQKRSKIRIVGRQLQLLGTGSKDDEGTEEAPAGAETPTSKVPTKAAGKGNPFTA